MKSFALCQLLCIFALPLPPLKANGLSSRSAEEKSLAWYLGWNLTVYAIGPPAIRYLSASPPQFNCYCAPPSGPKGHGLSKL